MIKHFSVKKLHDRWDHEIEFYDDVTLITGRNGVGKTAIIKLLWYLISGNIERTLREINFQQAKVITDTVEVTVTCEGNELSSVVEIKAIVSGETQTLSLTREEWGGRGVTINPINTFVARATGNSLFFPTFRRVEGGFATTQDLLSPRHRQKEIHELTQAIESYADSISVFDHFLVAALSTRDVNELLTRKYAEASKKVDVIQRDLSERLKLRIDKFSEKSGGKGLSGSYKKNLVELKRMVDEADDARAKALAKFAQLGEIVGSIFTHKGIQLTDNIVFGDSSAAVSADLLSAGEKQLLSFLCYNAFRDNTTIIIDEPEISLHPDWQRRLLPTLLGQKGSNQFILTTHSPFIFAKYPDREKSLSNDKGE